MFARGIEAAVAGIVPDARKVFLFHKTVVVFMIGSGSGKGDRVGKTPGQEGMLINSEPLSLSMPRRGNGRLWWMSGRASKTHFWVLLRRGRSSVHPEATSVASRVRQNSPESRSPQ